MPEALPAVQSRTPEQHASVRKRAWIFSLCGTFCGIAGVALLLSRTVDVANPPMVLAVNLSFCAMMMGIGIIFYAHGTPHNGKAIAACFAAIITGFAGPLVYARQSLTWHQLVENRELSNARQIATAALSYAQSHQGNYPPGLITLVEAGTVTLDHLHSPLGTVQSPADAWRMQVMLQSLQAYDVVKIATGQDFSTYRLPLFNRLSQDLDDLSDYQYFGADLKLPPNSPQSPGHFGTLPEEIIIATSRDAIMGKQFTVAYADCHSTFLDLGGAESALLRSNDAREALGFPQVRPPDVIRRAQDTERQHPPAN